MTGAGGGGTGAAIAMELAQAGMHVYANGQKSHEAALNDLAARAASKALTIEPAIFDVADESEFDQFMHATTTRRQSLVVGVHNAATALPPEPVETLAFERWREEFRVIADGAFLMTKHMTPAMKDAKWGRLIYISSNVIFRGGRGRSIAYPAAKSALTGLVMQAAMELGEFGITANIIAPSQIDTPRVRRGGRRNDASMAQYGQALPLGRVATPGDIANLARFLASDHAEYITAEVIRMDGGARLAAKSTGLQR
ncbi:MAG: SDR family NAD(P)-dependent oxidoreductase [Leucobacter sp.]|uniref:SDR family NAD(P)-dependent oxidoreductase n=1 Tax=Agrococcus casei TaxID=343512 RepID=UPI003F900DE6